MAAPTAVAPGPAQLSGSSGAIFFHLFTPLGVAVVNADGNRDGAELFTQACGVRLACALLLWLRRAVWLGWIAHFSDR